MRRKKVKPDPKKVAEIIGKARRAQETRSQGYRERALALFPHVCGRCCREFSGKDLRELTVHHKDHNHDNNPPDGSNWELLCVHCHDDEHQDPYERSAPSVSRNLGGDEPTLSHNPFADLLDSKEDDKPTT